MIIRISPLITDAHTTFSGWEQSFFVPNMLITVQQVYRRTERRKKRKKENSEYLSRKSRKLFKKMKKI